MDDSERTRQQTAGINAITLILVISFMKTDAYPDGSPISACNTMMPNPSRLHGHGATPRTGRSPYSVLITNLRRQDVTEYAPGGKQVLKVRIHGPKYRGYLLQARTMAGAQHRVGEFITPLPVESKFLECDADNPHSVVTHSCAGFKQHQTFFWKVPEKDVGPIYFVATIVAANRSVYWTLVQSAPLFPSIPATPSNVIGVETSRCGKGFGCAKVGGTKCLSSTDNISGSKNQEFCKLSLSWQCTQTFIVFEIFAIKDDRYAGASGGTFAGLILSKDPNMNDAELLICELSRESGSYQATSGAYYYHSKSNSVRPLRDNIFELKANAIDGKFYCRFSRPLDGSIDYFESPVMDLELPVFAFLAFGKIYLDGRLQPPSTMQMVLPLSNGTTSMCLHRDINVPLPTLPALSTSQITKSKYICLHLSLIFVTKLFSVI